MEVKKILKNVAIYLQLTDVYDFLVNNKSATLDLMTEVDLLVSCVNFVNNLIATDYIKLVKTKELTVSSNYEIKFENISTEEMLGVLSIRTMSGDKIPFVLTNTGVAINYSGKVKIKYAYFPNEVELTGSVNDYKTKINERIFAYGVASEYLFIKGNIDDASMWDTRFKRALLNLTRPMSSIKMPLEKMI